MAVWSGLWTVFFIAGFPALALLALQRRWPSAAFVAEHYHEHGARRYWEVVDMLKKVLLTSFILVFEEGTRERIATAVLIAAAFLLLHVRYQPFHSALHNRLETVALTALTLTYFIGLLIKTKAQESSVHAFDAILLSLVAAVVLAAALLLYFASRAGAETVAHAKHEELLGERGAGQRGRLVANARGLRLTTSSRSSSSGLGESLLGSVGDGGGLGGEEGEEERAAAELAHERLRSARLEAELARAHGEKERARREKEQQQAALEAAHATQLEAAQAATKAELAQLKAKTE